MFAILPDIWSVISRKVVLVVCGKFKITLRKSIEYMTLFSHFQSKICILKTLNIQMFDSIGMLSLTNQKKHTIVLQDSAINHLTL